MSISNRNIYRVLLIASFIGMSSFIIWGIGIILSYFNTGADRTTIVHIPVQKQAAYMPKVTWIDTINPGRPIEKHTLQELQRDYINAWYVKSMAYKTNQPHVVDDYYTTHARQSLYNTIAYNQSQLITIESTTTEHHLSLDFYSADGQLAVVTDEYVEEYQRVYQQEKMIGEKNSVSKYQVLLVLEDGFWRVRHLVKEKSQLLDKNIQQQQWYTIRGRTILHHGKPYKIKGINYYPQLTPWDTFGVEFDIEVIHKDFEMIKNKGLTTARIFVSYEDFGKEIVSLDKLTKLQQVLDLAAQMDLKLIVTLFDFYGNYEVSDWTFTHRHIEQIVSRFRAHTAILAWDIKNEPDLDFEHRGSANVMAWLSSMITQIRKYDPNHLITIGWSNIESATLLSAQLDIVSFHYYEDTKDFQEAYEALALQIEKPLVLQEFGLSSSRSFWNPFGASEKQQAEYYEEFQQILQYNNMHYIPWTLYDYKEVPTSVVGSLPWRKEQQKHFGFIDIEGNKKEAFKFIGQ